MKYHLFALLFFALVTPAYAAKSVEGTVPLDQPFLRPNVFVHPNVGGNVESHDITHTGQFDSSTNIQAPDGVPNIADATGVATSSAQAKVSKMNSAAIWLLIVFIILGAGFWLFKKKKP